MARTERARWDLSAGWENRRLDPNGRDCEHLNKRCPESWGAGCEWCTTRTYKRIARRRARHQARAALAREEAS